MYLILPLLFCFILGFELNHVLAYPNFVGHGYTSCLTCHYNPFGNGPVNDYGRALSATTVSSRVFFDEHTTEEELAKRSGFLGTHPNQGWFRPGVDYRGLFIKRNVGKRNSQSNYIHMQGDVNGVIKLGSRDQVILSGTFGYAPMPSALKNSAQLGKVKEYRTREHYIGYRPVQSFGVYAGLMDKIFGIRTSDHTNYSRIINGVSQNDQSHGIQFHYTSNKVEAGVGYFIGNTIQDEEVKQRGFSAKLDYLLAYNSALGLSLLGSSSEVLKNESAAVHFVAGTGRGSAVLIELGQNTKQPLQGTSKKIQTQYSLAQFYFNAIRGLYLFQTFEHLKNQDGTYNLRFGPGFQFFPMQRLEFRFDLKNTRSHLDQASVEDSWDLLGQVHLWF
jgi:hypothetical protein